MNLHSQSPAYLKVIITLHVILANIKLHCNKNVVIIMGKIGNNYKKM